MIACSINDKIDGKRGRTPRPVAVGGLREHLAYEADLPLPARPLSTLRTACCHDARKTRSRPAWWALAGRDSHPQVVFSFAQRTPRASGKMWRSGTTRRVSGGRLLNKR